MRQGLTIKVCGMRQADNIRQVEALGIDMMGFIFAPRSPRFLDDVPAYLPECHRVGVFVNADADTITTRARQFRLTHIQLHGSESPDFCREVHRLTSLPLIKATTPSMGHLYEDSAHMLLFDTPGGGTGEKFDWSALDDYQGRLPFLLAGGIGADDAPLLRDIRHPRFQGIDLNSRFETAPGTKDVSMLNQFINTLKQTY